MDVNCGTALCGAGFTSVQCRSSRFICTCPVLHVAVRVSVQAQTHLPTSTLLLEGTNSPGLQADQQQQREQQQRDDHDLPAVLKSSHTPVDMSLVLKAARDVPLHLLSAEYEKVRILMPLIHPPCRENPHIFNVPTWW